MIDLDNVSGIALLDDIKEHMVQSLDVLFNPSASYSRGQETAAKIKSARMDIAELFKVDPRQVLFTSGATEANNLAIMGYVKKRTSSFALAHIGFDHNSINKPFKALKKQGYSIVKLNYKDLLTNIEKVIEALKEQKVMFLTLSHVYPSLGVQLPLQRIIKKLKTAIPRLHIHLDLAQSFMKVDFKAEGFDSIALSGHKIGALQGVGALVLKNNQSIDPLMHGGKQNDGLRPGTENVLGILSFQKAVHIWLKHKKEFQEQLQELNVYFRSQFDIAFRDSRQVKIITPSEHYAHNIITMAIEGALSEHIIRYLNEQNILVGAASNCSDLNFKPPFLNIIKLEKSYHNGIVKVSFSPFNTTADIDIFMKAFKEAIAYFA